VKKSIDLAQIYYWSIQIIEPDDPDDDRYVVLHGEDGEVIGPLTVALAQTWIDQLSHKEAIRHSEAANDKARA
jgi:hypothetical protein